MRFGLIDSATSLRSDAPLTTTVLVADTGLAPGSSVVWTASFTRPLALVDVTVDRHLVGEARALDGGPS